MRAVRAWSFSMRSAILLTETSSSSAILITESAISGRTGKECTSTMSDFIEYTLKYPVVGYKYFLARHLP